MEERRLSGLWRHSSEQSPTRSVQALESCKFSPLYRVGRCASAPGGGKASKKFDSLLVAKCLQKGERDTPYPFTGLGASLGLILTDFFFHLSSTFSVSQFSSVRSPAGSNTSLYDPHPLCLFSLFSFVGIPVFLLEQSTDDVSSRPSLLFLNFLFFSSGV